MEERRSYQRFSVQLDVRLKKIDGSSASMDGTVFDVSFGGIGITVGEELQKDTEVSIEWPDPPFYCEGEAVVRCTVVSVTREEGESDTFRVGLMFSDPNSELAQRLLNWVQMQASRERRAQVTFNRSSSQQKNRRF